MKRIIIILIASLLIFSIDTEAQTYRGPQTTDQLQKLLNESKNPVIMKLDAQTKKALLEMEFSEGFPKALNSLSIKKLLSSNAAEVFTAIFGCPTFVGNYSTLPKFKVISKDEFDKLPGKAAAKLVVNYCTNCSCCDVHNCCRITTGGGGCIDKAITINNSYYHIGL